MDTVDESLKKWFGHAGFRPGQREAVEAVLGGRDAVVVMPTGSGKSLCYQLAAMMLPGTTLVISPLIALMKDQVDGLLKKECPATFLNSTVPSAEMKKRLAGMVKGAYKLVYIAPERFRVESFMTALAKTKISLLTIDEAHCISQWGHDFRPDYLEVKNVLARFPNLRVMAVTATATPDVRADIKCQLGLGGGSRAEPFEEVLGFARPNLHISVRHVRGEEEKARRTVEMIRAHRSGIVYAATRKHAFAAYTLLSEALAGDPDVDVLLYHGMLTDAERSQVQERFMSAKNPVVVATNAFGMGVDRADIRFVLHWDVPGGLEAYYQEIGRAGRDGKPARCELLFDYSDVKVQEFFNEGANPTWEQASLVLSALKRIGGEFATTVDTDDFGKRLGIRNGIAVDTILNVFQSQDVLTRTNDRRGGHSATILLNPDRDESALKAVFDRRREKARRDAARLRRMVDFCYEAGCRHAYILRYFGDRAISCGGCDNCGRRTNDVKAESHPEPTRQPQIPEAGAGQETRSGGQADVVPLLRRYVEIQSESGRLEQERIALRNRVSGILAASGIKYHDAVVDGEHLQVRCLPKTVFTYNESLLRERLGPKYEMILEPELKRMKAFLPEVTSQLGPLLRKVGIPSRTRIQDAIESGRIPASAFEGAFTRKEEISFAVTHPKSSANSTGRKN